jgi:hypothetical protein
MEAAARRFPILKSRLGDDGLLELHEMLGSERREAKEDVLEAASDRFERRLSEFRIDVTREFALVRVELAASNASLLRWMIGLWMTQLAFTATLFGLFFHLAKLI